MKTALCVGINYIGTEYELRGCLNDVETWSKLLGGAGSLVMVLKETQATRAAILHSLDAMIGELKAGDTAYFTYSGHGTWLPDKNGDEPDGRDEAICPIDMGNGGNLIVDDELARLFAKVPQGAHLVYLPDSCHSGTVYRFATFGSGGRRPRFLPPSHFLRGEFAVHAMSRAFGLPLKGRSNAPTPGIVHISACKDTEYASDAEIGGVPCGAFTYFASAALHAAAAAKTSYAVAFAQIRKHLPNWDYQQTPLLNATQADRNLIVFR